MLQCDGFTNPSRVFKSLLLIWTIVLYVSHPLLAVEDSFEDPLDPNILMNQITLEQMQFLEEKFDKWSEDLVLSFKSKSGLLPGIKTHAAPSAEIYFKNKDDQSFFLWRWFFKSNERLSTSHLRFVRVYLEREFAKAEQKEYFQSLIVHFHENAYRVYDVFMLENIENLHIAHNDIVQRLMSLPSQELSKYDEYLMLRSYLRVWTLSAIWMFTREALIKEQISKAFWKGDAGQIHNYGTNSVQDCRIAFMDLFKY